MNIIAYSTIRVFYEKHPITKESLRTWYTILKSQNWKNPQDAVRTFGEKNVDVLKNQRLCINIKGNHLRIVLSVNYDKNTVFIKWLGWHKDYDKLGDNIHTINHRNKRK